jgi:hypothetical protein
VFKTRIEGETKCDSRKFSLGQVLTTNKEQFVAKQTVQGKKQIGRAGSRESQGWAYFGAGEET